MICKQYFPYLLLLLSLFLWKQYYRPQDILKGYFMHFNITFRALALENSDDTLFYNSKKPFYHYTIPFYNTSTFQTSTSLFYSLK